MDKKQIVQKIQELSNLEDNYYCEFEKKEDCYISALTFGGTLGDIEVETTELIIVDDCSNDDTQDIVHSYIDPRIHYWQNEQNTGAALTRNKALRKAKGRYIAFLDSDDIWTPTKLEHQLAFMQNHNYAFTYHDYIEIDEASQPIGRHVSGKKHLRPFDMKCCCWPGCLSVMYDAQQIGLIQIPDIKKNNDTAMATKTAP